MFYEVKNLCFAYYKSPLILKDVNFYVQKNSKTLILASKENGKTTILKVLSGFEDSRFGNVFFSGKELKNIDDKSKKFSLILSEPVLFENKSIKYNLDFQCDICGIDKLNCEQINNLLKEFNLYIDANIKIKKLNLFEKRVLQVIRAIIKRPSIMFLDDQFEGLSSKDFERMVLIYDKLLNNKLLTIVLTLDDVTYKKISKSLLKYSFENILYLNLAQINKYKSLNEFEKSYKTLDMLNFVEGVELKECFIEKEEKTYAFCNENEKLYVFDKIFHKYLDELNLEIGEVEECEYFLLNDDKINIGNDFEFNQMIKNKSLFIYSKLTGFLLFKK